MKQTPEKKTPISVVKKAVYNAEEERKLCVIGKKISDARQERGVGMRELQRLLKDRGLDVGYASLFRWENGETVPNAYQLIAICDALEIPDAYSFFMNTGARLNETGLKKLAEYRNDLIASGRYEPTIIAEEEESPIRYIEMPVSTLPVSAGAGEFLDEENIVLMRFPESGVPAGADFALRVSGDSMEPVYQNRQLVWVQTCSQLRPGEVGIFVLDGEGYLKAYEERDPSDDEREDYTDSAGTVHKKPVLISYNPKYAPRVVGRSSSFKICGRVLN